MPVTKPATSSKSKISPARRAAFDILREVSASPQAHSDDLLQGPKLDAMSEQDRNLCTTLVMGTLRWQIALDAEIAPLLTHTAKLDEPVRVALRLGAFQLLLLDRVPAHAAISDSVELTKRSGHRFASGLVNAVLRKLASSAEVGPKLRSEGAHPAWLLGRWRATFGADAKAICDYNQRQPATALRIDTPIDEEDPVRNGVVLEPGSFLTRARLVSGGEKPRESFGARVRYQDEGSQLVAELLGAGNLDPRSVLDCCAAPGGKTAILAERYPRARVIAWDISASRVERMRERFRSLPELTRIECTVADAISMPVDRQYDLVLCDAPCSGTGTLARNPEIRHRLRPEDLARQQARQIALLAAALRHLAPGGRLVYSTCSLESEENEDVIARVLADEKQVRLLAVSERLRELLAAGTLHAQGAAHLLADAVYGNFLRTVPGVSRCDGFFAAILAR
jgi:16S rRNA (cytosine967-C5)-methyltransferase